MPHGPFTLAMTPAERAAHVPGTGVQTPGVGSYTSAHLNLKRSLADCYDIVPVYIGAKSVLSWKWLRKPIKD